MEPNPLYFPVLQKNRPNAFKFHGGICGSSTSGSKAGKVRCISLTNLVRSTELAHVRHVGFFSLNVEHEQLEVLETFPFKDVTVGVFLIRNDDTKTLWSIRGLLKSHGYCLREVRSRSLWFVPCEASDPSTVPQSAERFMTQPTNIETFTFNIDFAVAESLGGYSVVTSSLREKFFGKFLQFGRNFSLSGAKEFWYCFFVQVISQKVYISFPMPLFNLVPGHRGFLHQHVGSVLRLVQKFARKHALADLELVFNVGDGPMDLHPYVPVFGFVSCKYSKEIPFPIWDQANGPLERWDMKIHKITQNARKYLWHSRIPKVVFRGGLRSCFREFNATACGRELLVRKCLERLDLCDGALSDTSNRKDISLLISRIPMSEQEKFKFGIYTEGHSQWANRAKEQMFMGSALLMQTTDCKEYYTSQLTPWHHFIPVRYNFSDFFEAVEWARTHEVETKKMRGRMLRYAFSVLTQQKVEEYAFRLLENYAKLLKFRIVRFEDSLELSSCIMENIEHPELCREFH